MIWRTTFVALLLVSILTACGNRVEQQPCIPTKNKSLSAANPTSDTVQTSQC